MHGSPLQIPLAQPAAQYSSWEEYVHEPPAQAPGTSYTVRCVESLHRFAGGLWHVTPKHGSPPQAPAAHPNSHGTSADAYEHPPSAQAPSSEYTRRSLAFAHSLAGGWLQTTRPQGSGPSARASETPASASAAASGVTPPPPPSPPPPNPDAPPPPASRPPVAASLPASRAPAPPDGPGASASPWHPVTTTATPRLTVNARARRATRADDHEATRWAKRPECSAPRGAAWGRPATGDSGGLGVTEQQRPHQHREADQGHVGGGAREEHEGDRGVERVVAPAACAT